jgi:hypothetical protein
MRKLRCCITTLVLALACSTAVLAGDIQGPTGYSAPSPLVGETQGPSEPATSPSAAGEIQAPTATNTEDLSIGEMLLLKVLLTIF